jgi:hypothetical protein
VKLQKREAIVAAYLRAAHAYMLISMPTDTSTIFGVFQAILALLVVNRTNSALTAKLMRNEKFASEIFFHVRGNIFMLQRNRNSPDCATRCQTKDRSTGSESHRAVRGASRSDVIGRIADKELVRSRRLATGAVNRSGILAYAAIFL